MVFLYLKDVGGIRTAIPRLSDTATAHFEPFHLPFLLNVILTVFIVWLYTFRGGVKSLIWTDVLKTFCLVVSVVLCIYYIASSLHLNFNSLVTTLSDSDFSKTFFFR